MTVLSKGQDVFFYNNKLVTRREMMVMARNLFDQGHPLDLIKMHLNIHPVTIKKLLLESMLDEIESGSGKDMEKRFVVISQHPFPISLSNDAVIKRLEGPWVHACHFEDTLPSPTMMKVDRMGLEYGWIKIARLIPVDVSTLLDKPSW